MKTTHLWVALVIVIGSIAGAQTSKKPADAGSSFATRTAGLQRHDGFFPYYWDEKKGDILFEISPSALQGEFLYFTGLGSGIGSIETFADRSSFGAEAVCRFRELDALLLGPGKHQLLRLEWCAGLQHSVNTVCRPGRAGVDSDRRGARWHVAGGCGCFAAAGRV
jgi:hypothetical protein